MQAIEAEMQRIQKLVNKYDYKTPEIIAQRVQKQAFKKRQAQRYFTIEVVTHPDRAESPLELRYHVSREQAQQDAFLDGVYLLVAGGKAASLSDAEILAECLTCATLGERTNRGHPGRAEIGHPRFLELMRGYSMGRYFSCSHSVTCVRY